MIIGVTGTRSGMNSDQRLKVANFINLLLIGTEHEVHHGDCVGVDVEFAEMFQGLAGVRTVCHPPEKEELRAWHKSDIILEPRSYFARNRNIVDVCDLLFVIPFQTTRQSSGGTWYTHDYAVKKGVQVEILWPISDHIEQLMNQGR